MVRGADKDNLALGCDLRELQTIRMMKIFVKSLLVTSALSFAAPLLLIGASVIGLAFVTHLPVIGDYSRLIIQQVLRVLAVFGNGDAIQGVLIIGLTCSFVGGLFDTYALYSRYLRGDM